MLSIRLPQELEEKLDMISAVENATKSDIVRKALEEYISQHAQDKNPYALGEDLFDKYGSGNGTLSTEYKERVKEKINAKIAH